MSVIDEFLANATGRMNKSVEATHDHFNSVRTGRASAALLDRIQIDYYGTPSPLKNIATINVPESRLLTIQPSKPLGRARRAPTPRSLSPTTTARRGTIRACRSTSG